LTRRFRDGALDLVARNAVRKNRKRPFALLAFVVVMIVGFTQPGHRLRIGLLDYGDLAAGLALAHFGLRLISA